MKLLSISSFGLILKEMEYKTSTIAKIRKTGLSTKNLLSSSWSHVGAFKKSRSSTRRFDSRILCRGWGSFSLIQFLYRLFFGRFLLDKVKTSPRHGLTRSDVLKSEKWLKTQGMSLRFAGLFKGTYVSVPLTNAPRQVFVLTFVDFFIFSFQIWLLNNLGRWLTI